MKKLIVFIFAMSFLTLTGQDKMIVRIQSPDKGDYSEFLKKGFDIAAYKEKEALDLVVTTEGFNKLLAMGYKAKVIQTEQQIKDNLIVGKDLAGYRTYNDLLTELQQIETNHPGICKLYDIGDSRGKEYYTGGNSNYINYNHEIWALKVSDNVNVEEDEPYVYYMAEHHAREPISLEVNMYILNYIVSNYGTDPDVTNWVDNTQIWFMPLVNPNGHKIVTDEDDLWWRKNIRDNNANGQLDDDSYDGVDPNRNYGWHWGGTGSSGSPGNDTYHGPSAFSEPNIQAMKNMIDNYHFVTGITYHSYSELVLFPYGYDNNTTAPDHDALQELATDMAVTIPAAGGGHYTPQESWQLYPASGTTDDYSYGERGIFSYTVELGTEFIPPSNEISGICQDNLQAALILLDRVNHSTLTGIVRDGNTNLPIVAEVYIDGIDNTGEFREPYESDADFGRYYRLLMDGNYNVTYSAYGYIPQTFNNLNINSSSQTIQDVYLVPAQTVTVTGTVTDFDTGLPIENATVEVLDTPIPPVTTNQDGEYTIDNIMEGTYSFRVYAADYATIIEENSVSTGNTIFDFQLQESFAWSFESGTFEAEWSFGGNAPWFITTENPYDGAYCSQSGDIGDYQTSEMEITLNLTSGGDISFFRKVSSESGWDFLQFYIDGTQQEQWSGELDWAEVSYAVTSGTHTFKWVYDKDASVSNGSDCGWIDYIIFPPYEEPPAPPDIETSPESFEVTLTSGEIQNELLAVSNLGETDLDFSAQVVYLVGSKSTATVYPLNAANWTGTTDGSTFTDNSEVRGIDTEDAWFMFDVSSIPEGATINSIEFYGYVNYTYYPYWSMTPVSNDPLTTDAATLYADINAEVSSGYYLYENESSSYPTGWHNYTLEGTANADLEAALSQGWFAMGMASRDNSTTYYINWDGWNETNPPYLMVDYTYNPLNVWLTIDGSQSTTGLVVSGENQNIVVGFDATSIPVDTYYADIQLSSNDPVDPLVTVSCTLHVIDAISLDLKAMMEGPFVSNHMNTNLNTLGIIPLDQPFSTAPWNYTGTESVATIPNANITDWVLVELRETTGDASAATPATMIGRQAAFILNTGEIVGLDGVSLLRFDISITNNLFVVVWHRNHIPIISANPLSETGGVYTYDFTGNGQSLGTESQNELVSGVWGMISGDVNADGYVNNNDKSGSWETHAGESGFTQSDLNLDGQVDNKDKDDYWLPNLGKGTGVPQ